MVKFWDEALKKSKARCEVRIQLAEKHGIGKMAMEEKQRLMKIKKHIEDRKE